MLEIFESFLPAFQYCESVDGPIPQPLNFLSSVVYWLAAVWLANQQSENEDSTGFYRTSAVLLFLLGLSSMAWHTTGSPLALAADMFLMGLLLIVVVSALCDDVLRWPLPLSLGTIIILIMLSVYLKDASSLPHHAGLFLPLLFFMAFAALKIQPDSEDVTVYILSGAYLFFFGLVCRTMDLVLCGHFPQGLHFLWHIMLAFTLIYTARAVDAMNEVPEK